jgi:uncharacterized MAPEG superfamily protein
MLARPPLDGQTELRLLGAAALIGLLQLCWAATASQTQRGFAWASGPRDEARPVHGVAARLQRAMVNFLETFPIFAAALLAAVALGRTGGTTLAGAWLYVVARALYVPLYAAGAPVLRSLVWLAALVGILLELAALL